MNNLRWQIGGVKITQIIEADASEIIQQGIPQATPDNILKIPWLQPNFADEKGNLKAQVGVFIVETSNSCIIIDTGVGNSKPRKNFPSWSNLKTNFLEKFKKAGFSRDKVNYVLSTHMHFDHVGWNTMLVNDNWIPTFPKARYLFVENEFNYWKDFPAKEFEDDLEGIKDSVMPIFNAGLADLIPPDYSISDEISLIPTFGHTPGHVSVLIKSNGEQAVITGDVVYNPCQLAHPEWETPFNTDSQKATLSRKKLLEQFADDNTLLIGSHFASPTAGYLRRDGNAFRLDI